MERDVVFLSNSSGNVTNREVSWEADEDRTIHGIGFAVNTDNTNDGDTDGEQIVYLGSSQTLTTNGVSKDHNVLAWNEVRQFVDAADGGGFQYGFGNREESFDEPVAWDEGVTLRVDQRPTNNTHGLKARVIIYYTED